MSPNSPDSAAPAASARPSTRRLLGLFALGTVLGVFLHYLLYRFSLPIEPFIYVAF